MQCENIVKVENISFGYNGQKTLKSIDIEAGRGEFIGIMGPNGSGKTTLMRCISKLLSIQKGKISLNNQDIKEMTMMDIARVCTTIPADIPEDFSLTVRDFVALGRTPYVTNWWWEGDEDEKIVEQALEEFNITRFEKRKLHELSSGEQARVLLAKGVVQMPKIMLVDEPSAHLDLKYKLQVMESLQRLSRKDVTVLTASHDINLLTMFCDKVILISSGQILDYGPPCQVVTEEAIKKVYGVDVTIINQGNCIHVLPLRPVVETEQALITPFVIGGTPPKGSACMQ